MTRGVYGIFGPTGQVYVGSSNNIECRWRGHKCDFKRAKHHCARLREDFSRFGFENFSFRILEECDYNDLKNREQHYMKVYENKLYNSARVAGSTAGVVASVETRAKLSAVSLGRKRSESTKELQSQNAIMRYSDPEERRKQSERMRGVTKRKVEITCRNCGIVSLKFSRAQFCTKKCYDKFSRSN